jgi:hypothetical protein
MVAGGLLVARSVWTAAGLGLGGFITLLSALTRARAGFQTPLSAGTPIDADCAWLTIAAIAIALGTGAWRKVFARHPRAERLDLLRITGAVTFTAAALQALLGLLALAVLTGATVQGAHGLTWIGVLMPAGQVMGPILALYAVAAFMNRRRWSLPALLAWNGLGVLVTAFVILAPLRLAWRDLLIAPGIPLRPNEIWGSGFPLALHGLITILWGILGLFPLVPLVAISARPDDRRRFAPGR